MTDCTKCKYYGLKQTGEYSAISTCALDMFKHIGDNVVEPPKNCPSFERYIEGLKYDTGKNRIGLVLQGFSNALWEVGKVGTFGCERYGEFNWKYVDNAKSRYKDALFRHLFQYMQGKDIDDESGLRHLSHACWNALALLEFDLKESEDSDAE